MSPTTLVAVVIFLGTYISIGLEKINRSVVAAGGAILLLIFRVLTLEEAVNYVSWETLGLLFGMFILIAVLSEAGFFAYTALLVARKLRYDPYRILVVFPLVAGLMAAFMDSITVMLFFATLTYELSRLLKFDPVPVVVAEVCLANIGGAATLVGDPPNVILGLLLGFTFNDFVIHNGPTAILAAIGAVGVAYLASRRRLVLSHDVEHERLAKLDPAEAVRDWHLFRMGLAGFGAAIALLVSHTTIQTHLGIPVTAPLAALVPAFVVLTLGNQKTEHILRKIDYEIFIFFTGLFVVVGGLEKTGAIDQLARLIASLFQGMALPLLSALLWFSGVASAVVDNVPFALSMAYVIQDMATQPGVPALALMVWAVSLGTDIGGNGTPIGASANVVAYGTMEKHGHHIGWRRWMRLAIPPTLVALLVSNAGIAVKYLLGFH